MSPPMVTLCRGMLGSSELVAFVTASDADRAADFYAGVLGLHLAERTPFALVFGGPDTTLRVALAERVAPAPHTVLGWRGTAIAGFLASLAGRGVSFEYFDGM